PWVSFQELLFAHGPFILGRVAKDMTQQTLIDDDIDLADFFASIHSATDKNPLTHGLHPYPAKFIPHIPRALIAAYSKKGDLVCDPMCGSGTTMIEAAVAGRASIGIERNPVGALPAPRQLSGRTKT